MTFAETEWWQQADVPDRAWILFPAGITNRTLVLSAFSLERPKNFNQGRWKYHLSRELPHSCALSPYSIYFFFFVSVQGEWC